MSRLIGLSCVLVHLSLSTFKSSLFLLFFFFFFLFFFFQAEDGIRDLTVTGVQTCALPISWWTEHWDLLLSFAILAIVLVLEFGFDYKLPDPFGLIVNGIAYFLAGWNVLDRKSTRLNSSHSQISYAVFCLKKKNKNKIHTLT